MKYWCPGRKNDNLDLDFSTWRDVTEETLADEYLMPPCCIAIQSYGDLDPNNYDEKIWNKCWYTDNSDGLGLLAPNGFEWNLCM